MRHLRRLKRVLHDDQAGFSLAGIIVALALLGLVSALSVTALGDAYRSAGFLRTTVERQTDAGVTLDLINDSLAYADSIEYATATELIVRVDEPDMCVQRGFQMHDTSNSLRTATQSIPLPAGTTCRDIDTGFEPADSTFFTNPNLPPLEPLVSNVDTNNSTFAYYGPGNITLDPTPTDLCAITRVRTEITTIGGKGAATNTVGTGTVTARTFGVTCP